MAARGQCTQQRAGYPVRLPRDEGATRDRRRTIALLVYGFAVAAIATALASAAAPDTWPLLGTRINGYNGALRVLNEGGPPLLQHSTDVSPGGLLQHSTIPGEEYAPAGNSDDQGSYLYVPLTAKLLGIADPADALRVLYLAMFAVPLLFYPLIFYGLFRSIAPAALAPVGLAIVSIEIAAGRLGSPEVYWVPAWAALALLPPLLLLDRWRPRVWLVLVVGLVVSASFATSMRSNAGLPVAISAALIVFARRDWTLLRRGTAIVLVAAAYLSIAYVGLSAVREYRNDWVDSPAFNVQATVNSHPVWHNAYIGLGYFPNDEEIFYRDEVAANTVRSIDPDAGYLTPEYERILRDRWFDLVTDHPRFFLAQLGGKLVVTASQMLLWLVLVASLAPFAMFAGSRAPLMRRFALLIAPAVLLALVPPLATVPFRPYELGLAGTLSMCSILLLAWLATEVETLGPAEIPVAVGRPWVDRRVWWAAGGILLAIGLFAASKPLEKKANDWQIEHGSGPLTERTVPDPAHG